MRAATAVLWLGGEWQLWAVHVGCAIIYPNQYVACQRERQLGAPHKLTGRPQRLALGEEAFNPFV